MKNIIQTIAHRRGFAALGILALSLVLRADGCATEERTVEATVPVTLEIPWTTDGFLEANSTSSGLTADQVNEILDALDDADLDAVRAALAAGAPVRIGGVRAEVIRNDGHVATREADVSIEGAVAFTLNAVTNTAGTVASFANGRIEVATTDTGLEVLRQEAEDFLDAYLADDRDGARTILLGLEYEAAWTSTPAPTSEDPDDFDWTTTITILVPAQYTVDVPNL